MTKYIIYSLRNGEREVGVAHEFQGRLWWEDARHKVVNTNEHFGPFEKTLKRLLNQVSKVLTEDDCEHLVPPYYDGTPYKVIILKLRQEDL